MSLIGRRIKYVEFFDPNAVDEAVGRCVELGECGTITDVDDSIFDYEIVLVKWDRKGSCWMNYPREVADA